MKVDWAAQDVDYLRRETYEVRFAVWLEQARAVSLAEAMRPPYAGNAGDVRVAYSDASQCATEGTTAYIHWHRRAHSPALVINGRYVSYCKRLQLMEDLKAGVPRTGYHGVVLITVHGRRVFIAPKYRVEQDITGKRGG